MDELDRVARELFILTEAFHLIAGRAHASGVSGDLVALADSLDSAVCRLLDAIAQDRRK